VRSTKVVEARPDRGIVAFSPVLHFVGIMVCGLGAAMLLPALLDLAEHNHDWVVFAGSSIVTLVLGTMLVLSTRGRLARLGQREAVLAIVATWIAVSAAGALPFTLTAHPLPIADAVFETVSGLTATGSTVMSGLDSAPRGLLLWRFLLIWLGGFGLVTFAILVLPYLRIGGMQLFQLDLSARPGKFMPRFTQVTALIAITYLILTLLCALAFYLAGMSQFDALGHGMAAIATGGFSSHDAGIGYFQSPAIEWIASVFMLLSALPFATYIYLLKGDPGPLLRESQIRLFLLVVAIGIGLLAFWRMDVGGAPLPQALREATFNLVSAISTTGFTSENFSDWGGFAELILWAAMLIGGCTGSTAGGIKAFRLYVLIQAIRAQISRQIHPSGLFTPLYNGRPLPETVLMGVALYFFLYLATVGLLALALGFTGLDFRAALGASATAVGGVGPGLGPTTGPCCTFASISPAAKWLMAIGMLAGRLEILIMIMPFSRMFWRS
jgi:trk system potassium uptake protein TrkH